MKKALLLCTGFACAMALAFAPVSAQDKIEKSEDKAAWFDMDNCEVCQNMAKLKEKMMDVQWETHLIENGFLSVSVVPESLAADWEQCKKGMNKTIAKLESGGTMDLCGYCSSMGELMAAGAKKEEIKTAAGNIFMLTSSDPAVVKKIHATAKRTMAEYEKMKGMMEKMQQGSAKTETKSQVGSGR